MPLCASGEEPMARTLYESLRSDIFLARILQTFLVDRDPRILQFTVDLQYFKNFFCTAGRARAQISEILRTL